MVKIAIVGDFNPQFHSHHATHAAIQHSAKTLGLGAESEWVPTEQVAANSEILASYHGVWASPGSPYRSFDGMLRGIEFARTRDWPFVGT